jgi:hypothetical protein
MMAEYTKNYLRCQCSLHRLYGVSLCDAILKDKVISVAHR